MSIIRHSPPDRPLPNGADIGLPWHLGLPAPLERGFQVYLLGLTRTLIRSSFVIVLILLVSGSMVEVLIDPASAMHSWRARLIAIMASTLTWWLAGQEQTDWIIQPSVCLTALIISITNNYLSITLSHSLSYTYYLFNLLAILLMGTLFRITFRWSLINSALILLLMIFSMLVYSELTPAETLVLFFFVLAGGVLSLYGQYNFEKLQRKHFLAERVLAMHRNELHSANLVLENQATEDPLTGAVNRRGMEERLNRQINLQRQRKTEDGNLYVLLFDIDFFKQYNDSYGHLAGDDCLRTVSTVVQSMIQREADFIARYGGEEFLVALNGIRLNDALVFAERVRDRIEKQGIEHKASRNSNVITISVGVAGWRPEIHHTSELIRMADEALYEAKGLGRNRVVLLDEGGTARPL
ncbi:GGDEF domain-containing protein [Alcanivorax sp. 1008]|uniref:GGDEF domain-containing protein n=1 Tax=Alcanivorax sp. 1008 TaxID=2816853 RepID=UPI001D3AD9B7|nr:GGDEF domain-containing protein [Alcanivorax sp. 1008]MCC1497040.1 GGDEF domain-containing protein [Alcanivorax sp. 1008]